MALLFQSNFDSGSGTQTPPTGFTVFLGNPDILRSEDLDTSWVASGIRGIGSNVAGANAYVTVVNQIGDVAIRTSTKIKNQLVEPSFIDLLLRSDWTTTNTYISQLWTDGTGISVNIAKLVGGVNTGLANSGYIVSCVVGDVIHHEAKAVGSTLEVRIWKNATARPVLPTLTTTDTSHTIGYVGLEKSWSAATAFSVVDDVVVTDGTGSTDYFYPDTPPTQDGAADGGAGTSTGSGTGGAASTSGGTNANAGGGAGTSTGSGSGGTASGLGSGTFTSDAMENNTGAGLLASTSVSWTWYQGVIGAAPTSTTHGTGTTSVGGVLTVSGLPTGTGFLLVRTADSSGVYYQPGTVT